MTATERPETVTLEWRETARNLPDDERTILMFFPDESYEVGFALTEPGDPDGFDDLPDFYPLDVERDSVPFDTPPDWWAYL